MSAGRVAVGVGSTFNDLRSCILATLSVVAFPAFVHTIFCVIPPLFANSVILTTLSGMRSLTFIALLSWLSYLLARNCLFLLCPLVLVVLDKHLAKKKPKYWYVTVCLTFLCAYFIASFAIISRL